VNILKLQCVQNCLASVVALSPQFFSFCATPKIYSLAPCSISHNLQSLPLAIKLFLSENLHIYFSCCHLRTKPREICSSGCHLLSVPWELKLTSLLFGIHSCVYVKSSDSIVTFSHYLKTHLFRLVYPS